MHQIFTELTYLAGRENKKKTPISSTLWTYLLLICQPSSRGRPGTMPCKIASELHSTLKSWDSNASGWQNITAQRLLPDELPKCLLPPSDRKSTRLNSSHVAISY